MVKTWKAKWKIAWNNNMRLSISATKFHHGRRVLGDTEFRIEGTQFRNFSAASIVLQAKSYHSLQRQYFKFVFIYIWDPCKDQDITQKWERRKGWVRHWLSKVSSACVLAMVLKPFCFCGGSILSNINICFLRHWSLLPDCVTKALPKMQSHWSPSFYFKISFFSLC